jgi:mevalonate kinase
MIRTSAPGKLLLLGDYAVVYGYPCLVTAVNKRLNVSVDLIDAEEDDIITPQVKESRFVLETIAYIKEKFSIKKNVRISTQGDFSHQVGLGSSSAVTVATAEALNRLFQLGLTKKDIFEISYTVNLLIQGVGSGFDIAAATFGGTLEYVKGGTTLNQLSLASLPLVVGYSGIKADTPYYIRKVAEAFRDRKNELTSLFEEIRGYVEIAKAGLTEGNFKKTGEAMTHNHVVLQKLGVSIPKLDAMVNAAVQAGAWGAKLSGAGGGDCMIALVDPAVKNEVEDAISFAGGEIIPVQLQAKGVE